MSHTLTETISFDPSVVVPDILDTDYPTTVPQGVQALANRSQFLLDAHNTLVTATNAQADALTIVRSRAMFSVGTGTPGGLYALAAQFDGTIAPGAYSLSSNRIHVPFAGKYRLEFNLYFRRDSVSDPVDATVGCQLYLGEAAVKAYYVHVPNEDGMVGQVTVVEYLNITAAASQLINLRPFPDQSMLQQGTLDLQRLA